VARPRSRLIGAPTRAGGAIGFGATLGTGSTDGLTTLVSLPIPVRSSFFSQIFINGTGGGTLGRVWQIVGTVGGHLCFVPTVTNKLRFNPQFSVTSGNFDIAITASTWHSVGWSYDASSTSNVPIAYLDFAKPSVTVTTAPSGTFSADIATMTIGND